MWDFCHMCYQATGAQMTGGSQKKNPLRQHAFLQSFCSVALERSRHIDAVVDVRAASLSLKLNNHRYFTDFNSLQHFLFLKNGDGCDVKVPVDRMVTVDFKAEFEPQLVVFITPADIVPNNVAGESPLRFVLTVSTPMPLASTLIFVHSCTLLMEERHQTSADMQNIIK